MPGPPAPAPRLILLGDRRRPLQDLYHALLIRPWWFALGGLAVAMVALNLVFALVYWAIGGVANVHGFGDCFFFSIQTAGTIGYGGMTPTTTAANVAVAIESIASLLATALATGIVFAKYSRSTARIRFARHPTIAPFDGQPTLRLRIGNMRGNSIVEAQIRVVYSRTHVTREGETFYPQVDLTLVRDRAPALARAWTVMHTIDATSPLAGATAASLAAIEAELLVSVTGVDETTLQTVHARTAYDASAIAWGARPADIVEDRGAGGFVVDLGQFDELAQVG
ncbi:MAG: ATP-sensitive inward rectifier potassium channel 10 [Myxococcales bacterium]|nr:ATP-sensitive inward rectifier potassium channel 10 [Myxococcales bacterium]